MKANIVDLIKTLQASGANVSAIEVNTSMADRHAANIVDLMESCLEEAKGKFGEEAVEISDVMKIASDEIERRKAKSLTNMLLKDSLKAESENTNPEVEMQKVMQQHLDDLLVRIKAREEEMEKQAMETEALKDEADRTAETVFNGPSQNSIVEKNLKEVIETQPHRLDRMAAEPADLGEDDEFEKDDETQFLESEDYDIIATLEILGRSIYLCSSEEHGIEIHQYHDGDLYEDFQYGCKRHGMGPGLDAFAGMVSSLLMEERSSQAIAQDRLDRGEIAISGSDMQPIVENVLTKLFGVDMSSISPMKQAS